MVKNHNRNSPGRPLAVETIAEGVETEEQLKMLRNEDCEFAQGFLLGRPVPAVEFDRLLDREKMDTQE